MALSSAHEKNGTPGASIATGAKCTIEKVGEGFGITSIVLDVRVAAPGLNDETLKKLAEETKKTCPVSRALSGTRIHVTAPLGQGLGSGIWFPFTRYPPPSTTNN